jgi:hypothetical protein
MSRGISVGVATGYGLYEREAGVRVLGTVKNFLFRISSRPALNLTKPPMQWLPGVKRLGVKLSTYLQQVLGSRKHGSIYPLVYSPYGVVFD